ncbi:MAG: ankyrin repeat domain-containing protein [Candidatus Eremiobacteraeota bacterium]|nr:ankyrin repeat domain-containing protein [Candidatus Eremiobacteraeota bacterium]
MKKILSLAALVLALTLASCTAREPHPAPPVMEATPEETPVPQQVRRLNEKSGEGAMAEVKALLAVNPALAKKKDNDGFTCLHYAAIGDQVETAAFLIEKGADVNAVGPDGRTALHFAAKKGFTEMTELLLEKKAYGNIVDREGKTPMAYAKEGRFNDIIELFRSHSCR